MHSTNLSRKSANAAATAEQRHITYHKVSQSHLPTPASVRGSGEEEVVGGVWQQRREVWGTPAKQKGLRSPQCARVASLCPPPSARISPPLTLWSHRERSKAWRCRWRCWSSLSLSVVASSAPPGNADEHWKQSLAGLESVGHIQERLQSVAKILIQQETDAPLLLLLCRH